MILVYIYYYYDIIVNYSNVIRLQYSDSPIRIVPSSCSDIIAQVVVHVTPTALASAKNYTSNY